jgi:hypothetical protein
LKGVISLILLKILAFLFLAAGALLVFGARRIVSRYKLDRNVKCEYASEMTEEELALYRNNRATVNMKMIGMLVALPGLILILVLYR